MGNWSKLRIYHVISTIVHVKSLNKILNLLLWPSNWNLSICITTALWTVPWQYHEHGWCSGLQCRCIHVRRVQLKHDDTRWRTVGEVKGKLANAVGSQYPSHYLGTWCIQHYYRWCAHLGCQQWTELTPPHRFKWTRPFRRKTKSGFCVCAITFQT